MPRRISHSLIETIAAESPKFTAPLLLVHGLWCTAAVWHRFMGFLAHRGWSCGALSLWAGANGGGSAFTRARFADYLAEVEAAVAGYETPPVVVGHDLGALLALHCSAPAMRAVVALAPLIPAGAAGVPQLPVHRMRIRLAAWRSAAVPPPAGRRRVAYLGSAALPARHESSQLLHELCTGAVPLPSCSNIPILVLAGELDRFSPTPAAERLARAMGAAFRIAEGAGHAMPWEAGWERRVSEVHRWLVQTLGDPLLAMREEEE